MDQSIPAPSPFIPSAPQKNGSNGASTKPPQPAPAAPSDKSVSDAPEAKAKKRPTTAQAVIDLHTSRRLEHSIPDYMGWLNALDPAAQLRWYKAHLQNVLLLGPPGIGKSAWIKQVSDWFKDEYYRDIRLALHEPPDLIGFPWIREVKDADGKLLYSQSEFSRPHILPPPEWVGTGTMMFDEINTSPIAVQNAALQPFQAPPGEPRQLGSHIIPSSMWLCAAGNEESHVAHVHMMGEPLRDRFHIIRIEAPNIKAWTSWAFAHGVNKDVIGFLNFKPEALFHKAPGEYDTPATPRGWAQKVSPLADIGMTDYRIYTRAVGEAAALMFQEYLTEMKQMPDIRKVLLGKEKFDFNTAKLSIRYAVLTKLVDIVENDTKLLDPAMSLAAKARPELTSIFIIGVLKSQNKQMKVSTRASKQVRGWILKHASLWNKYDIS